MAQRRFWSRGSTLGLLAGALLLGAALMPFARLWRDTGCEPFDAACPRQIGSDVYALLCFFVLYALVSGYLTARFLNRHAEAGAVAILAYLLGALAFFGSIGWVLLIGATY